MNPDIRIYMTGEEVTLRAERIRALPGFAAEVRFVWEKAGHLLTRLTENYWQRRFETLAAAGRLTPEDEKAFAKAVEASKASDYDIYVAPIDETWVRNMATHAHRLWQSQSTSLDYVLDVAVTLDQLAELVLQEYEGELETIKRLMRGIERLCLIETEIVMTEITAHERWKGEQIRRQLAEQFQERIATIVEQTVRDANSGRQSGEQAALQARAMLGTVAEVAAAAEQSASAMLGASQTANGLITAIDKVRERVETSSALATRATGAAEQASLMAEILSEQASAIESILAMIQGIAGGIQLLSLNATIEAARAGEAGRGFAIVASEVKSLANQTTAATEDISKKVVAIKGAMAQTVEANARVGESVADMKSMQETIRAAMDEQARTVAAITAALNETAMASEATSLNVVSIRQVAEDGAQAMDKLAAAFRNLDDRLVDLGGKTREFVDEIAT